MKKILFLAIFVAGCNQPFCEYEWIFLEGITICTDSSDTINTDGKIAIHELETQAHQMYKEIGNLKQVFSKNNILMYFTKDYIMMSCVPNQYSENVQMCKSSVGGVTIDKSIVYVRNENDCLARTAFVHELLHVIDFNYTIPNPTGNSHDAIGFFRVSTFNKDITSTLEYKVNNYLYHNICEQ